jgi:hypothetical protein
MSDLEFICQSLSKSPRRQYIGVLEDNGINCEGPYCVDGEFKCNQQKGEANNCYHVEHIIDMQNSLEDVKGMDKNILPNLIMAYAKWNRQIGQLNWMHVENEKREVYGDRIVNLAIHNIKVCDRFRNPDRYGDADDGLTVGQVIMIIIGGIFICLLSVIVYWLCCSSPNTVVPPMPQSFEPFRDDIDEV